MQYREGERDRDEELTLNLEGEDTPSREKSFSERIWEMRDTLSQRPLSDFRIEDLGPILRVLGEFRGDPLSNQPTEQDLTQLSDRLAGSMRGGVVFPGEIGGEPVSRLR